MPLTGAQQSLTEPLVREQSESGQGDAHSGRFYSACRLGKGTQGCSDGREEAEGRILLQQDPLLPSGQAPAPPLGFRVNTSREGHTNTFAGLQVQMPTGTGRFQGGSVDVSCEDMAPPWPAREPEREAECGSSWLRRRWRLLSSSLSFSSENLTALSKAPRPCGLLAQSPRAAGSRLFRPLCCVFTLEPDGGS